eukprot:CAMPEP_0116947102 /NCGR_PEP_ID=MMETSP0467-20121206/37448_1 /TAXON_ID=283647 /ORGANISM="Mesodinium pulex, Strain SPMC105" /LENGTH=39 /DNA_ID= /DNA_START= /DNA_END= /DNA_ORIENTATION=
MMVMNDDLRADIKSAVDLLVNDKYEKNSDREMMAESIHA